jgi:two-component system response regulator AtoC
MAAPDRAAGYTVLVVDDDPSVLATYGRLLRRAGYRTLTEADPCCALQEGQAGDGVDLLLLDHRMPGMDGLTLLAELRRRQCKARCILVSAYLNDDVRNRAATLGVDRVLEKPVDVALLRSVIRDLLPASDGTRTPVGWNAGRAKA